MTPTFHFPNSFSHEPSVLQNCKEYHIWWQKCSLGIVEGCLWFSQRERKNKCSVDHVESLQLGVGCCRDVSLPLHWSIEAFIALNKNWHFSLGQWFPKLSSRTPCLITTFFILAVHVTVSGCPHVSEFPRVSLCALQSIAILSSVPCPVPFWFLALGSPWRYTGYIL